MSHHVLVPRHRSRAGTGWLVPVNVSGVAVRQPPVVSGPGARIYDWEGGGGGSGGGIV